MQRARLIGIPGSGKTTRGMEIIAKVRDRGIGLNQVGFCTFTRAARREASSRAAECFGCTIPELERQGWFRTIHSACMKLLGLGKGAVVNYDQGWLREAMQDGDISLASDENDDEGWTDQWRGKSAAVNALKLWDVARNKMCPLIDVYQDVASRIGSVGGLRSYSDAERCVDRYEDAKRKDQRVDFVDTLLLYAGKMATCRGIMGIPPQGEVPNVPVWLFDEAQDTSPLLDCVAQRLSSTAIWYYLMGDPDQGIYGWAGADPESFLKWQVAHEEKLTKTYRCAWNIIQLGLRLLWSRTPHVTMGGYGVMLGGDEREDRWLKDREMRLIGISPRCDGGEVLQRWEEDLAGVVDPKTPSLVMARTNMDVARLQNILTRAKIPWRSVKSPKRWPPVAASKTVDAMNDLAKGEVIDGEAWRRIVTAVPKELLVRGTKTRYAPASSKEDQDFITLGSLHEYGAKDELINILKDGRWKTELVEGTFKESIEAKEKWGDLADNPKVVVSTIHGTKGMEAENVYLATGIPGIVRRSMDTEAGYKEERRVWYVGATRAKQKLVLLRHRDINWRLDYEPIYCALKEMNLDRA